MEGWQRRDYGWKLELDKLEAGLDSIKIKILPHQNTGMGAKELEFFGGYELRPHHDTEWERVEHIGFERKNAEYDGPSLRWVGRALHPQNTPLEFRYFFPGERFYSVMDNIRKIGYYHILENTSPETILLKIDAKRKS